MPRGPDSNDKHRKAGQRIGLIAVLVFGFVALVGSIAGLAPGLSALAGAIIAAIVINKVAVDRLN